MTDCTDCNIFQFCQFLKLLGQIMIVLVLMIVGLTYYAVIIATAAPGFYEGGAGTATWSLFVFITFHFLVCHCHHLFPRPNNMFSMNIETTHFGLDSVHPTCTGHNASLELLHSSCN